MKIIEGLKKIKDLQRKVEDIRGKISTYCADLDIETATYENQANQVKEWLQSCHDIIKEIETLRLRIQKTNLHVTVPVEIIDKQPAVTKSIAAWIHRRKDLAKLEESIWSSLSTRGLQPQAYRTEKNDKNSEVKMANVRKYYNQLERDKKVEEYTSEPSRIDAALEITNATTDLLE